MFRKILLGGSSALALLAAAPAYATCTLAAGQDCTVTNTGTISDRIAMTGGDVLKNQGSITGNGGTGVVSAPQGAITIENGTTANASIVSSTSNGIWVGIDDTGGPAAVSGSLAFTQGSATTTGTVSVAGDAAAVRVANTSGNVTINNVNGTIQGVSGLDISTAGQVAITNGDGTHASKIISTGPGPSNGYTGAAIVIGSSDANASVAPTFSVTNNANSQITANGANSVAIFVGHALGGASSITNHGTISGSTAFWDYGGTGSNHVTITNDGTITGDVKMVTGDLLNLNGGSIAGNISGGNVSVGGNSTVNGNIGTANLYTPMTFGGDHTLTMGSGKTIYGNVTAGTDGQGTVAYSGSTNIYADMGQSGKSLKAVTFNGGSVNLDNSNYYVGTTTVNSGATLGLCSTYGCSSSNILNGDLSLNGGTLNLINGGNTTTLAAGSNSSTGAFTTTSGSVIKVAISGNGNTSGAGNTSNITHITAAGVATLATGTTVTPTVNALTISNGARYILVDGIGTASVGTVTATNSALVSWNVLRGDDASLNQDAGDVYLVASKRELTSLVTSPQAKGAATALTSIASSSDAGVQRMVSTISGLSTSAEVDKAVKELAPSASVAAATTSGSTAATTANINTVNARAAEVRTAQAGGATGVATGDSLRGLGLWIQGLGFSGSQDQRKGQDGYDATTGGLAVGGDVQVAAPLRIGAAFSYARTNVDAKGNSSGSGVDINSYQGTLYANYTGSPWYVDAALVYGRHQYDSTRTISFLGAEAKGNYDGNQYTAQVAGGYPLVFGSTVLTPNASLAYSLLKQNAYEETGAPGANLSVDEQSATSVRSGLGVKVAHAFESGTNQIIPEGRATWFHEFRDNAPNQTAQFSAGGSAFTSTGAKPAQNSAVLGVGLTIATADQVSVSANYDAELKDHYVGHNGMLQVRLDF